jgi:hypothetical protein
VSEGHGALLKMPRRNTINDSLNAEAGKNIESLLFTHANEGLELVF